MIKITISKQIRKGLILVFIITGLAFVVSSDKYVQSVGASICCEECPGDGDPRQGRDDCGYTCAWAVPSSAYQQCFDDCLLDVNSCYSGCTFCYSSGSGSCNGTSECPIGMYCGADNHCHY